MERHRSFQVSNNFKILRAFPKILQFLVESISFFTQICNTLLDTDKHEGKLGVLFIFHSSPLSSMFVFDK